MGLFRVTAQTPIYGIKYLQLGEPIRTTRAVMQQNAETIETALAAGGVAPAGAADHLALAARVGLLEAGNPAPTITDLAITTASWQNVAGYRNAGYYRNRSGEVRLTSMMQVKTGVTVASGAVIATLPVGFRLAVTGVLPLTIPASPGPWQRADLNAAGQLLAVGSIAAGVYLFLDGVGWLGNA